MAVGAILGAGASLAGIMMQAKAQEREYNLNLMNLYEQKRQARKREKLARSSRTDAYRNKVKYVVGQGFVTETTPMTRGVLNAQQKEQLEGFRVDAPRQRAAAGRIDKRSKQAGEVYDEKFNEYRYGRRKSKKEYIAEAIRNTIDARRGNKNENDSVNDISRMALRTGNQSSLVGLLEAAKRSRGGKPSLAEAIAEAKRYGAQQYLAESGAEDAKTFGELNQLRSTADAFIPANLNYSNENAALSGRQDNALSGLIQTNAQGSNAVGQASGRVAASAGKFPNVGGLASSLNGIKGFGGKKKSPQESILADLLLQQRIGSARVGINNNNNALYKQNEGQF